MTEFVIMGLLPNVADEQVIGFSEQSITWILVLFGCGVTIGNIVGGKLADWKLITHMGPSSLPWMGSLITVLGLLLAFVSYMPDRRTKNLL